MDVMEFVEKLIITGTGESVSDIHFKPDRDKVEIYFRVKGRIIFQQEINHHDYKQIVRFIKYKSKLDIGLSRSPQDGSYRQTVDNEEIYIRVSVIPLIYSESIVIRLLYNQEQSTTFDIAYYPSDLEAIYKQILKTTGLFVFTGPTGSGKSTSMYTLLKRAAKEEQKKVICIEDPVEVINEEFTQIQINEEAGLTYTSCLRAALRHDPDIIMIGEIRDEETAKSVFRASLTGHTVISTMHTKNKYGVIERFLDFDFKQSEISSVLMGISNQRLLISEKRLKALYDYVLQDEINDLINFGEFTTIHDKLQLIGYDPTKQ